LDLSQETQAESEQTHANLIPSIPSEDSTLTPFEPSERTVPEISNLIERAGVDPRTLRDSPVERNMNAHEITFPDEDERHSKDSPSSPVVPHGNALMQNSEDSRFTNDGYGQSVIQDIRAVETHNSTSSEGQPQKPSFPVKVDAIATFIANGTGSEHACGDDLLAPQVASVQLKHSLTDQAKTVSSLKHPETSISKSRTFTNHMLVKCEDPFIPYPEATPYLQRAREMEEIRLFLHKDFRFIGFTDESMRQVLGRAPDEWLFNWYRNVCQRHDFKGDDVLFIRRCNLMAEYLKIRDIQGSDTASDSAAFCLKMQIDRSRQYDHERGNWVSQSYVPYIRKMGQCERTLCPSHVDDGGGDALEPIPMKSERTYGPSRGTGDALQMESQDMDRSSPSQSQAFPRRDGPSQC
jgi:hypothetical protein